MGAAPQVNDPKFNIEVVKGPHAGLKMGFAKDTVTIGRGPENDIVLSNDPRVSRQHAEIRRRSDEEYVVINLTQKNFTMVNGQLAESELLKSGSLMQIGETEILFIAEISPVAAVAPVSPLNSLGVVTPLSAVPKTPPVPAKPMVGPQSTPMSHGGYQSQMSHPLPPPPTPRAHVGNTQSALENPRVRFYGIIGVVAILGYLLFSPSVKKAAKDPNEIRTSAISMKDVAQAEKRSQEMLTIKKEKYDSVQYRRAQENFVKGFRDFQQGQYARAIDAFQVVLNLDQDNELAQRYYNLSRIKFDELVKFNMIQGNRYREKKNWRMCQSNYSNVITMLANRKDDPSFKEAKQYYEECSLNLEGRF